VPYVKHLLSCSVVCFAVFAAAVCLADQITLSNGDRLTGKVQRLSEGKVVIETDYAGEVSIDLKSIAAIVTDGEMTVVLDDDTRTFGRLGGNGERLQVTGDPPVDAARVTALLPGRVTGDEWKVSGRINVGASDSSGNTEVTRMYGDAEVIARKAKNRFTLGGRGNYTEDRGTETESNATVYGKYDRFLTRKWYLYANTSFENDKFKDLQLRSTLGAGTGYQFFDTPRTLLSLEGGLDYVHTDFYSQPTEEYPAARVSTRFAYWLWQDILQFFHDNSVYMSLEATEDAFARTQTGLRFPLRANFLASAQLNLDWDGNPAPGRESIDQTVILSLGYRW
jgi:putative salt-induced outer membrane protein YdiY